MSMATLSYWRVGNPGERCLRDSLLAPSEVHAVLMQLDGPFRVLGELMFATGLRVEALLALRVRDIDLAAGEIIVRAVDGTPQRYLRLSDRLVGAVRLQVEAARSLFAADRVAGRGEVPLPAGLGELFPLAGHRGCWQFLFPSLAPRGAREPRGAMGSGEVQQALAQAGQAAGLRKPVHSHSLRHAFAAHLVARRAPVEDVQELMGHDNRTTTERYIEALRAALEGQRATAAISFARQPSPGREGSRWAPRTAAA